MKCNYQSEEETLKKLYQQAIELIKNQPFTEIDTEIKNSVDVFIQNIETNKSLIQVIITSLL